MKHKRREPGSALNPSPLIPLPKGRGGKSPNGEGNFNSHRLAPKLLQQRFEFLDHHFMGSAVCSYNPIPIVDAYSVVAQRLTEEIRQASAGFRQNTLRPARVPLPCARRKMQIEVRLLFGN